MLFVVVGFEMNWCEVQACRRKTETSWKVLVAQRAVMYAAHTLEKYSRTSLYS